MHTFALMLMLAAAPVQDSAGGLKWTAPASWTKDAERPMRAVTYKLPAAKGDAEGAELAVFYFGEGQGGAVDANVKRWLAQFQKADGTPADKDAKTKTEKVNGMNVTTVDVKGTYLGGGPMMGATQPKPGYRLLGAIIEGAKGPLFFKLTGPEKTVQGAEGEMKKLLKSVKAS